MILTGYHLSQDRLHMNQLKTLFKIVDKIMLEPLGKEALNFNSPKACAYFSNAKDTHKSFQALQILLHGTAAEFCYQYINWCSNNKSSITAQVFLNWMDSAENETMHLVYQLIFNFSLAIYVQKTFLEFVITISLWMQADINSCHCFTHLIIPFIKK